MVPEKDPKELSAVSFRALLLLLQFKKYFFFFPINIQNPASTRVNLFRYFISSDVQCCPIFSPPSRLCLLKRGRVSLEVCGAAPTFCSLQSCVLASVSPQHLGEMLFFLEEVVIQFLQGDKKSQMTYEKSIRCWCILQENISFHVINRECCLLQ